MANQYNQQSLDLKFGSLILGLVTLYAMVVLFISPITSDQLFSLIWTYLKTLPITFIVIFFTKLIFDILSLGIKKKFKASPFSFCLKKIKIKWKQDRFFSLFWPVLAFSILIPSFNVFKQTILSTREFTTDPLLAKLDSSIFEGNPGLILHELIGSQKTTVFLDNLNQSWFIPMFLSIFLISFSNSSKIRVRYMSSYVFSWIFIGSILAYLLPSAGPCFYIDFIDSGHDSYALLMDQLYSHHNNPTPIKAIVYQQYLAAEFGKPIVKIGSGISAMPSVHVALATLFALGSFSFKKYLGFLMTIYAFFIWVGSIYLGWHYFVDGLVSCISIILFWKFHIILENKQNNQPALINKPTLNV